MLDEIDMHLQRTGVMADPDALAAFYGKFNRGKDGEIDDATGAAMLKELNALPDVAATA